jgi:hypothetical protein
MVQQLLFDDISFNEKSSAVKSFENRTLVGRFLLLGAGVQSGTLVEMACAGVIEKPTLAVFADTGDEPQWVYEMLHYYQVKLALHDIPLVQVKHTIGDEFLSLEQAVRSGTYTGSLPLWVSVPGKRRPSQLHRHCTSDWKVAPTNAAIRKWLLENRYATVTEQGTWTSINTVYKGLLEEARSGYAEARLRGESVLPLHLFLPQWVPPLVSPDKQVRVNRDVCIETLFGISTDEAHRLGERGPSWQKTRYPLVEMNMSRDDCVEWLKAFRLPVPKKSACRFCPYRSHASWQWFAKHEPETFELVCLFDDWLRSPEIDNHPELKHIRGRLYIHQWGIPLREAVQQPLFEYQAEDTLNKAVMVERVLESCSTDGGWSCMS